MKFIVNDFIDFIYCGHSLSEFNGVIGDISGGDTVGPVNIGSELNLNPIELKPLKKRKSVVATYDSYVEKQFSFFKNPCDKCGYYTYEEVVSILRWLNQPQYEDFVPVYSNTSWPTVHYNATFNVQPIIYMGNVIGFQLDMTTDAPFGYYDEVTVTGTDTITIEDKSDEQGFIYPRCIFTIHTDGHLILYNTRKREELTIIANCASGETIILDGEAGTIQFPAYVSHENIQDDFNYVFPKIWNGMGSGIDYRTNIFIANLADTEIEMTYKPISKFGLI